MSDAANQADEVDPDAADFEQMAPVVANFLADFVRKQHPEYFEYRAKPSPKATPPTKGNAH
ncbi:MAG: hypothetical protein Q4F65_07005 [Propionibacteriaceae bacterium]|nr:hypothetical protein [Propionibacteriaceae bacterium]